MRDIAVRQPSPKPAALAFVTPRNSTAGGRPVKIVSIFDERPRHDQRLEDRIQPPAQAFSPRIPSPGSLR